MSVNKSKKTKTKKTKKTKKTLWTKVPVTFAIYDEPMRVNDGQIEDVEEDIDFEEDPKTCPSSYSERNCGCGHPEDCFRCDREEKKYSLLLATQAKANAERVFAKKQRNE